MSGAELTGVILKNPLQTHDNCQRIDPNTAKANIHMNLPDVREANCAWYITTEGEVFNATGYIYDSKTFFNASCYKEGELTASKTNTQEKLAIKIADVLLNNENIVK